MTKTKTFNYGGQRRTVQTGCGYTASGSVRDCNFKINLHKKNCPMCSGAVTPTEFDSVGASYNGWDGLRGSNKVEGKMSLISKNGTEYHSLTEGNSMESSFNINRNRLVESKTEDDCVYVVKTWWNTPTGFEYGGLYEGDRAGNKEWTTLKGGKTAFHNAIDTEKFAVVKLIKIDPTANEDRETVVYEWKAKK